MKKYITKWPKKAKPRKKKKPLKLLFVSRGPGETAQARALAKYASKKGSRIIFAPHQKRNLLFLSKDREFRVFLTETPRKLIKIAKKEKPEVILFFNTKMWARKPAFYKGSPFAKNILTLGVDSNWLFNNKKYPKYKFIEWMDKYLVLFPRMIFELGLKEKKGDFLVPKKMLDKIIPVGFIPSYKKPAQKARQRIRKKYGIRKDEKFIFSYFSGFGAGHRVFAFNNLIEAVDRLVKSGRKIKVLYVGSTNDLDKKMLKRKWLLKRAGLDSSEYFLTLSSSDLVFQHQGMVTLSQALSSQIPVICNVHILKDEALPRIHFWEVSPFKRAGVAEMFSKSTPIKKISKRIEELLYNPRKRKEMQRRQKEIFRNGEEIAFKVIKNLIKSH